MNPIRRTARGQLAMIVAGLSLSLLLLGCESTSSKERPPSPTDPRSSDSTDLDKYLKDRDKQQRDRERYR